MGQKGQNNGLVLLWATDDRKLFIATGYGLEGAIPDAIAKRIISTVITPEFKNQMYYRGLDRGIDEIMKYAKGEYKAEAATEDDGTSGLIFFFVLLIVMFFIIRWISKNGGGGRGNRGGGMFFPYTTYSGWGSSSGSWGGGDSGGGSSFGGFGGGSFGGGGAGGDY